MTGGRRKARAIALQVLYEVDSVRHDPGVVLACRLADESLSGGNGDFISGLVNGVVQNKEEMDHYIEGLATAWPVEQIAVIDRNILRLAIFEILFNNEVSVKIVINEAVELAKKFGSDNSSKFVNGVLGSVSTLESKRKALS
ncbi:transcription antitermination factor NusB [Chloroflexota bacterium]